MPVCRDLHAVSLMHEAKFAIASAARADRGGQCYQDQHAAHLEQGAESSMLQLKSLAWHLPGGFLDSHSALPETIPIVLRGILYLQAVHPLCNEKTAGALLGLNQQAIMLLFADGIFSRLEELATDPLAVM